MFERSRSRSPFLASSRGFLPALSFDRLRGKSVVDGAHMDKSNSMLQCTTWGLRRWPVFERVESRSDDLA
jgi:hypothetical protein